MNDASWGELIKILRDNLRTFKNGGEVMEGFSYEGELQLIQWAEKYAGKEVKK